MKIENALVFRVFLMWIGSLIILGSLLIATKAESAEQYTVSSSNNSKSDYSAFRYTYDRLTIDRSDGSPDTITTNTPCPAYSNGDNSGNTNCWQSSTEFGSNVPSGSSQEAVFQCFGLMAQSKAYYDRNCDKAANAMPAMTTPNITKVVHAAASAQTIAGLPNILTLPDDIGTDPAISYVNGSETMLQSSFNKIVSESLTNGAENDCASITEAERSGTEVRCNEMDTAFYQYMDGEHPTEQGGGAWSQDFEISFSIDALTDADGNLVGSAEGSWTLTRKDKFYSTLTDDDVEVTCSGTFTYDETGGYQGAGNYPNSPAENCYQGQPN